MTKETLSTFERMMKDPARKKSFDGGYKRFLLSELLISLMERDNSSVRALGKELELSPTVIQSIRSGRQVDLKASNFLTLLDYFGYSVTLVNKKTKKTEMTLTYEDHHISAYSGK